MSRTLIPAGGSVRDFTIPFPYLQRSHIHVAVDNVTKQSVLDYVWVSDTVIRFLNAPTGMVLIYRQTPAEDALVTFRNGAQLTEAELNTAILQTLYVSQELRDYYEALVNGQMDKLIQGIGGDPSSPLIDQVVAEILNSELLAHLSQRIEDIDLNANTILDTRLSVDDLRARVNQITGGSLAHLDTIILAEQEARIQGDEALVDTIALLGARSGDSQSFILDENSLKVSPSESLAQRLSSLLALHGENQAAILTEATARASQDEAFSKLVTNVTTRVGAAETLITEEATARSTADAAMGRRVDGLLSQLGTTTAMVSSEAETRATADTAMGKRVDGVLAEVNNAKAAILAEQTARANGDSAEATARQTLQTKVNQNTASIQTQSTVLDGLKAQYSVRLDVNGHVIGFGLLNNGTSGEFLIRADKFALVTPGAAPKVPFAMSGGNVFINTDLYMGGGRIVNQANGYQRVEGSGFGTTGQFLEWYGPIMALHLCSEENGICYLKKDGSTQQKGNITGSYIKATAFDLGSTRISTGGSRLAPFTIRDSRYIVQNGTNASRTLSIADFVSPDYGSGYIWKRFARHKMDVWLDIQISGDTGNETAVVEVQYNGGGWTSIQSITFNCNYRGSFPVMIRYTTADSWDTVAFRVRTTSNRTEAMRFTIDVYNFNESGNAAGSNSGQAGAGGNPPAGNGSVGGGFPIIENGTAQLER